MATDSTESTERTHSAMKAPTPAIPRRDAQSAHSKNCGSCAGGGRTVDSGGRPATVEDGRRLVVYDRDYVRACLEDAGQTLMAVAAHGCWPKGHQSQMPEPLQDFWLAYGRSEQTVRWPRPTAQAIDRMDATLPWLRYVQHAAVRRVVALRMLTHPLSDKPIWSWKRLAHHFGIGKATAERWYAQGLDDIVITISGYSRG